VGSHDQNYLLPTTYYLLFMKLIIGLGNPGEKYTKSRHNIGFRIIDSFRNKLEAESISCSKFDAETTELHFGETKIILIKPMTFMNLSGESVQQFVNFYKADPEKDVLIIYDDKDLMFSTLRQRDEGSSGGHNGIKSLIKHLGTQSFHRLKFGVGHEEQNIPTDAFVLQRFSEEEETALPHLIDLSMTLIEDWIKSE
jgi:PTH1 family peptidyl-tRNA hydrolase